MSKSKGYITKLKGYITEMPLIKSDKSMDFYLNISISDRVIDKDTYNKLLKAFNKKKQITIKI